MNKIMNKIVLLVLILTILLSNFCYAIELTNETLKASLKKLFSSNIKIETCVENESGTGSSTSSYTAPSEIIIDDNQITLTEIEGENKLSYKIDYLLENNSLEFIIDSSFIDYKVSTDSAEDTAMSLFMLLMLQNQSIQLSYLATADSLGLDLEMANSYYSELLSLEAETIEDSTTGEQISKYENDIFTYTIKTSGESAETFSMLSSMIINLDNFSKITESDLSGTTKSVITISNTPIQDTNQPDEKPEENIENVENTSNTATNTIENQTNDVSNRNVIHVNTDNTVANTIIPSAGTTSSSFIILLLIALGLFFYSRSKYYDDIIK